MEENNMSVLEKNKENILADLYPVRKLHTILALSQYEEIFPPEYRMPMSSYIWMTITKNLQKEMNISSWNDIPDLALAIHKSNYRLFLNRTGKDANPTFSLKEKIIWLIEIIEDMGELFTVPDFYEYIELEGIESKIARSTIYGYLDKLTRAKFLFRHYVPMGYPPPRHLIAYYMGSNADTTLFESFISRQTDRVDGHKPYRDRELENWNITLSGTEKSIKHMKKVKEASKELSKKETDAKNHPYFCIKCETVFLELTRARCPFCNCELYKRKATSFPRIDFKCNICKLHIQRSVKSATKYCPVCEKKDIKSEFQSSNQSTF